MSEKIARMDTAAIARRLQKARREAGYDQPRDAAKAMGLAESTYYGHENGSRGLRRDAAERYARFFRVSLDWLLTGRGQPTRNTTTKAQVVGYVGAGAAILPLDDQGHWGGIDEIDAPFNAPEGVVAVIVRGDSMYPRYLDGEVLFYVRDGQLPAELVGRECVVQLADGRMLVKTLRRGTAPALFHLESYNAPTIEDQEVAWAAPVRWTERRG